MTGDPPPTAQETRMPGTQIAHFRAFAEKPGESSRAPEFDCERISAPADLWKDSLPSLGGEGRHAFHDDASDESASGCPGLCCRALGRTGRAARGPSGHAPRTATTRR